MIILDTNVISELTRPLPSPRVMHWIQEQSPEDLCTTTVTEAELIVGLALLPDGKRKQELIRETEAVLNVFGTRVFPFDREAARAFPLVVLQRKISGLNTGTADGQIAAIARSRQVKVATRDATGFRNMGVPIINPWTDQP